MLPFIGRPDTEQATEVELVLQRMGFRLLNETLDALGDVCGQLPKSDRTRRVMNVFGRDLLANLEWNH